MKTHVRSLGLSFSLLGLQPPLVNSWRIHNFPPKFLSCLSLPEQLTVACNQRTRADTVKEEDKWKQMLKLRSGMRSTETLFSVSKAVGAGDKPSLNLK